mgnify:CR=1 FL=1
MEKKVRAIRGAIQVEIDRPETVLDATAKLLTAIVQANGVEVDDVISAMFTTTPDLNSCFPAEAARGLGFAETPLICAQEINVPGAPPRIIRILLWAYSPIQKTHIRHVYLDGAESLRKDIAQ